MIDKVLSFLKTIQPFFIWISGFLNGWTFFLSRERKEELNAIEKSKRVRDNLNRDPDAVKRVRDRFTRR